MLYSFEDFVFDTDRRDLRRDGNAVSLQPQVFDLLEYLIQHRERVVTKDDLIAGVWGGRIVSESALTTRINAARTAVGDSGEAQRLIRTFPRKGVRFVGTVQEQRGSEDAAAKEKTVASIIDLTAGPSSAPRLSIVVLPFANIGGDPEQDYFVDGVTESLTTDLSRISGSFVIGRHTAFTYKGKQVDLKQIGHDLNVRYALEGSVQRSANRLRVNAQLIDTETGNHLWADRFDKPVADLFDMQDEIVSRLANTLNAELTAIEARRAKRSLHPDAMDLNFQGYACLTRGFMSENVAQAQGFFERALAVDPQNIEAMVGVALVDAIIGGASFSTDRDTRLATAEATAIKVLSLAPDNAFAHLVLGTTFTLTNRATQGVAECERALALDRNLADAHAVIGWSKLRLGRAEETEGHVNEALRLSPRDVFAFRWMAWVGMAKLMLGADAEAVTWLRRSIEANRNLYFSHFQLGAGLARLGLRDQARVAVQTGLALDPTFTIRRLRTAAGSDNSIFLAQWEYLLEGLRLAGVPEG